MTEIKSCPKDCGICKHFKLFFGNMGWCENENSLKHYEFVFKGDGCEDFEKGDVKND